MHWVKKKGKRDEKKIGAQSMEVLQTEMTT